MEYAGRRLKIGSCLRGSRRRLVLDCDITRCRLRKGDPEDDRPVSFLDNHVLNEHRDGGRRSVFADYLAGYHKIEGVLVTVVVAKRHLAAIASRRRGIQLHGKGSAGIRRDTVRKTPNEAETWREAEREWAQAELPTPLIQDSEGPRQGCARVGHAHINGVQTVGDCELAHVVSKGDLWSARWCFIINDSVADAIGDRGAAGIR